ncbi:hypothetical protein PW52_00655 [Tamlana sedimentorum]|uniref:Uncharacterized protein n=1 Tax=Neotamlana sedimentorum TaxID=1435349 RepID=A0A0D7WGX3_9FLAO|nr:hypothetical protein [Tamlana sedimentorum]KJD37002.1 hypothetical protein PW52_00655 [Tamlana sedimentorum]
MKAKYSILGLIAIFSFILTGFTSLKVQEDTIVITAIFDGKEDYGYNFVATSDDLEYTVTFHKISDEVAKSFDLNSDKLIGTKFKITYTSKMVVTKDEDGYDYEEEINTIKKLQKL